MRLFGQSTPFDADIEKATSETNTNENWSLILDVCDKVSSNPRSSKDCLKAIMKRMGHADPHIVMQALTLLDACVSNCGKPFHLEIASRDFENEFRRLLSKAQGPISMKMRQVLKNWAENDFKTDPELNLIPSLYAKLRQDGYDFSNLGEKPQKTKLSVPKDPNVVSSQQEEDDIAAAIELSLKETKNSPKHQSSGGSGAGGASANVSSAYPSLYPSFSGSGSMASITSTGGVSNNSANSQPEPRKVRALYDFEAAEENELTFFSGEIIHVLDDTDPNWWKGYNQRGEGLFPSNFVTADLSVDPERLDINQQNKTKKSVQFEDDAKALQIKTEAAAAAVAEQRIEIDEVKIDRLLHLLHEANPEDPSQDSEEMLRLEQEVNQMGPLIDAELERVDRKHAQLTQLSSDLVDAINLYHSLMHDDRMGMVGGGGGPVAGGYMPPPMVGAMPGLGYQGVPNSQMLYGAAGYSGGNSNFPQHMQQTPQQIATHNYGMQSLPYPNVSGQLSGNLVPASTQNSLNQNVISTATTLPGGGGYPIPLQYQNGHVNSTQMNGNNPVAVGINTLPSSMNSLTYNLGTPLPATTAPPTTTTDQHQQLPPSTGTVHGTPVGIYNPTNTQLPQMGPFHNGNLSNQIGDSGINVLPPDQQLPHHLQQHPQQQYGPLPNATTQPPQNHPYMTSPPQSAAGIAPGFLPPPNQPMRHNPANVGDQYSQLQQQMAAMSLAGGFNQPVTQNFLVQNDPKHNIPIYQQQR